MLVTGMIAGTVALNIGMDSCYGKRTGISSISPKIETIYNSKLVRQGQDILSPDERKVNGIRDQRLYAWRVADIDGKGIELAPSYEPSLAGSMTNQMPGKSSMGFRIDYGKERRIGEGILSMSVLPTSGGFPETVIIRYSYSVPRKGE